MKKCERGEMGTKIAGYRAELRQRADWKEYILANSNLPGPRGNLELAEAVFQEGERDQFLNLIAADSPEIEENTPQAFALFCGVFGMGKLLSAGDRSHLPLLKHYANDRRWRVREAVAMAMQKFGLSDMTALLDEMRGWSKGSWLEQRAVVAGLCEPALLKDPAAVDEVLALLDEITAGLTHARDRKDDNFRTLRQALAYGWSVAAAADLEQGKPAMERWMISPDPDVRWLMRENLKKNRLIRLDKSWVDQWSSVLNCV